MIQILRKMFANAVLFGLISGMSGCGTDGAGVAEPNPAIEESGPEAVQDSANAGGQVGEETAPDEENENKVEALSQPQPAVTELPKTKANER